MPLPSSLILQIRHLQSLAAQSYEWLKLEIAHHLAREQVDVEALDHLLEQLYPAFSMGVDEGSSRKLVAKMAQVDPKAAAFYLENFFEEGISSDESPHHLYPPSHVHPQRPQHRSLHPRRDHR